MVMPLCSVLKFDMILLTIYLTTRVTIFENLLSMFGTKIKIHLTLLEARNKKLFRTGANAIQVI